MEEITGDESRVLQYDSRSKQHHYIRSFCQERNVLSDMLLKMYGYRSKYAVVASSGVFAISCLVSAILRRTNPDDIISIFYPRSDVYCDTPRLFEYLSSLDKRISLRPFDFYPYTGVPVDQFGPFRPNEVVILFVEACSNPNGLCFDFNVAKKLKQDHNRVHVIVDNTWLTHVIWNPFNCDAVDYVVLSLTKYYSGGTAIGGAVLDAGINDETFAVIEDICHDSRMHGHHIDPYHLQTIIKGMEKMEDRIRKSSGMTIRVIDELTNHGFEVIHPYIDNSENMLIASNLFPSVFVVYVDIKRNKFVKRMSKRNVPIEFKTSFGSAKTKIDPWPKKIEENVTAVRVSIGYDDEYDRIIEGLKVVFSTQE